MTTRTSTSTLSTTFAPTLANLLAACAMVAVTTSASLGQAEPAAPTTTVAHPTKPEKKGKGTPARVTAGKTKATSRSAKPAKGTTPPAATAESTDKSAAAKPSQVMDFDTDDVAGTRLEPGFELVEGAPAKARHKSLVEPLKPSDSVVHRQ